MQSVQLTVCLALLCGACGRTPPQEVTTIDKTVTVQLQVRLEVNDKVEDSQKATFTLAKGSPIPAEFALASDNDVKVTFRNLRLKNGMAIFDAWGFDGFTKLSSKSGTKCSPRAYHTQRSGGFSIPADGSQPLEQFLTFCDSSAIDGELVKLYADLSIKTD